MTPDQVAAWLLRRGHIVTANQLYCCQRNLLDYVSRERRIVTVTRHGRAIARIVPLDFPAPPGL